MKLLFTGCFFMSLLNGIKCRFHFIFCNLGQYKSFENKPNKKVNLCDAVGGMQHE